MLAAAGQIWMMGDKFLDAVHTQDVQGNNGDQGGQGRIDRRPRHSLTERLTISTRGGAGRLLGVLADTVEITMVLLIE